MIFIIVNQEEFHLFCFSDGYLLLKLLHSNSSDINMSYLIANLFHQFLDMKIKQSKRKRKSYNSKNTNT